VSARFDNLMMSYPLTLTDFFATFAWNSHRHLELYLAAPLGKFDKKVLRERYKDWKPKDVHEDA